MKSLNDARVNGFNVLVVKLRELLEEMANEQGKVFRSFAQWGNLKRHHIETEVQIFSKLLVLHERGQMLVGGGDDPHVDGDLFVGAHGTNFGILEHA